MFKVFVLRSFLEFGHPWILLQRFALLNDSLRWTLLFPILKGRIVAIEILTVWFDPNCSFSRRTFFLNAFLGHATPMNSFCPQRHQSFCATFLWLFHWALYQLRCVWNVYLSPYVHRDSDLWLKHTGGGFCRNSFLYCSVFSNSRIGNSFSHWWKHVTSSHVSQTYYHALFVPVGAFFSCDRLAGTIALFSWCSDLFLRFVAPRQPSQASWSHHRTPSRWRVERTRGLHKSNHHGDDLLLVICPNSRPNAVFISPWSQSKKNGAQHRATGIIRAKHRQRSHQQKILCNSASTSVSFQGWCHCGKCQRLMQVLQKNNSKIFTIPQLPSC